ncbi:heme ABC exporter ATP-binding protein CcmA [Sphingomonas sanguinis]|uniref:Heme ABC exporter ATP-binding protein CcmA n=1 Tax=Sphingomonas sanguinis TaxID=33051 RepID=A0A7Y7URJ2_9SPHN|nr:heme ABC exporter ATP-binding protein CcmA [Sphingomonas sanguinis]MBZ6381612.1 heme ABC exporter ATP-binding protein CcmA [Sphingomonas sanguinis]NNG48136.1 heme ABC exporter ATP-binding protein CcmA [Sphingomonas sanguinis]NNG53838.1 heme ABC exporter ATP-binding protein CcmA [Sphingomonas sanguinis]NVP30913.1 heme ABC exporter ATP-binding protein CcmA [Sphingomonas sanguinis]
MILELNRVACARGGRLLFAGLSLSLGKGEAAIVTGPNGIGKSSLLRLAAGLIAPFEGRVARAGRIALMTEDIALDTERRLGEALLFWARLDGLADAAARVAVALETVGLAALAEVPVRLLSTGQRRRAALARVWASQSSLWLLDEPGNGLDVDGVAMLERVLSQHRAGGGAVLLTTHQPLDVPGAGRVALDALVAA